MIKATFKARLALEAVVFTSKEKTRYYLHGFAVEPHPDGGVLLISTDGHRLICIHDPDGTVDFGDSKHKLLVVDIKKPYRHLIKKMHLDDNAIISVTAEDDLTGSEAQVGSDFDRITFGPVVIDGPFPDWRKAVPLDPCSEHGASIGFNSSYLADFNIFNNLSPVIIRVLQGGEHTDSPSLVLVYARSDVFGVLMPARGLEDRTTYPDWFAIKKAEKAKK